VLGVELQSDALPLHAAGERGIPGGFGRNDADERIIATCGEKPTFG
jgi:hypothetical protein